MIPKAALYLSRFNHDGTSTRSMIKGVHHIDCQSICACQTPVIFEVMYSSDDMRHVIDEYEGENEDEMMMMMRMRTTTTPTTPDDEGGGGGGDGSPRRLCTLRRYERYESSIFAF